MKRRGLTALLFFFIMTTAAFAPVAFRAGVQTGLGNALAGSTDAHYIVEVSKADAFPTASDCETRGSAGTIGRPDASGDCPVRVSDTDAGAAADAVPARKAQSARANAASRGEELEKIVVEAIAKPMTDQGGAREDAAAVAFAETDLASGEGPAGGVAYFGQGTPPVQVPSNLPTPKTPTVAPPVLETPVPGGAVLLLTALSILWVSSRRRRSSWRKRPT